MTFDSPNRTPTETPAGTIDLLIRMLWTDGRMANRQIDAIVAMAEFLGETDSLAARIVRRQELASPLAIRPMSREAARVLYAAAAWVAAADLRAHPRERELLDELRDALSLRESTTRRLEHLASQVAHLVGRPRRAHAEALLRAALNITDGLDR